ncbi:hypothetical protein CY0110_15977 [Crocosphaera chwakensis CCY0110]|uniref:Uncharacterized protein n=1 Tax=Crocosphaera chwakensis CCY0110 TaxID=391612 RepID=A3IHM7_9CHRO|nr:hypothetical protein CY0110_15977 [Crocosphaera chwakensis CCY0110]
MGLFLGEKAQWRVARGDFLAHGRGWLKTHFCSDHSPLTPINCYSFALGYLGHEP